MLCTCTYFKGIEETLLKSKGKKILFLDIDIIAYYYSKKLALFWSKIGPVCVEWPDAKKEAGKKKEFSTSAL